MSFSRFGGWVCVGVLGFVLMSAPAAAESLDKGHQILINEGLQIQATVNWPFEDGQGKAFDWDLWAQGNFTSISNVPIADISAPTGTQWGRWRSGADWTYDVASEEVAYVSDLVTWLGPDEVDLDDATVRSNVQQWFQDARATGHFDTALLSLSQYGKDGSMGGGKTGMQTFMSQSQPDMLFFQQYPWRTEYGQTPIGGSTGNSFYTGMEKYRWLAAQGNDGTGSAPIPFGWHAQAFRSTESFSIWKRYPSTSEMRLETFAGWTYGAKVVTWFMYNTFAYGDVNNDPIIYSVLFEEGTVDDSSPTAAFTALAETNRQSLNLSPTLVRLTSTGVFFVQGQYMDGGTPTDIPLQTSKDSDTSHNGEFDCKAWDNAKDPYITSILASNLGTLNDGLRGDVLVGYFQLLDESFDGAAEGETYFMITNGLSDDSGTPEQTRQSIRIEFDFGDSGITSLQRLSRDTGLVELVTLAPLEGGSASQFYLDLVLDGGTGDLFKFNTGASFVVPEPASVAVLLGGLAWATVRRKRAPARCGSQDGRD